MFKKSKSKVLVDEASEEDDVCWHQEHANKARRVPRCGQRRAPSCRAGASACSSPQARLCKHAPTQTENAAARPRAACNSHIHHPNKEASRLQGDLKDKESERTEEVLSPSTKDSKSKKVKSKRDRGDKKLFPSQDDEDFLLTGVTLSNRKGAAKKSWEEEKSRPHSEKNRVHCLWDSITMTMRQITPNQKIDKMEGWEPPQLSEGEGKKGDSSPLSTPLSLSLPGPLSLPSWTGLGPDEDSSRYSSLAEPQAAGPAQWAARARDKLAAVRRRSPGSQSENAWEGLK